MIRRKLLTLACVTWFLTCCPCAFANSVEDWWAVLEGDLSGVRHFLTKYPQAVHWEDGEGETALLEAAEDGKTELVQLLLDCGADIAHQDEDGETALMEAAAEGHLDCVALLLRRGSPVGPRDKKERSALDQARGPEVRRLLMSRGAR